MQLVSSVLTVLHRLPVSGVVLSTLLSASPGLGATFEALCGSTPCRIRLDASGIEGPSGFIPAARIAQWFGASEPPSSNGLGNAAATAGNLLLTSAAYAAPLAVGSTYVTAPLGLVSGLVRGIFSGFGSSGSRNLSITVIGYDTSGQKITHQFRFVNPKPAGQVMAALPLISGLGMGQTRSLEQLRLSATSGLDGSLLPDRLDSSDLAPAPAALAGEHHKASATGGWERYLQDRGLVDWAAANPRLANQLRQKLFPGP